MPQNVWETLFNAPVRNKSYSKQSNVLIGIKKGKVLGLKKKETKKTFFWQQDGMAFYSRNCMSGEYR